MSPFDRMLTHIERRSALTVRRLPVRHPGSEGLMRAVRPRNAAIANLRLREQPEPRYAFHWRITYRADDKREELYTVVLDDQGAQIPLSPPADAPVDVLEPLGSDVYVSFLVGGSVITGRFEPGTQPAIGSRAPFTLNLDRAHFFDKTSGSAIT